MPDYDYIIVGAGAAGLSLLTRMIRSSSFSDKKILLVDRERKTSNDRTWCFWEKQKGFFEEIVYKKWQSLWFYAPSYSAKNNIYPYEYKLIRGIDFYNYCFDLIQTAPNVEVRYGNADHVISTDTETWIEMEGQKITAAFIFSSIIPGKPKQKPSFHLLQHFKGWVISTEEKNFNATEATLMDFRVPQLNGTTFFYVMPFADNRALVEYTIFSESILAEEVYVQSLNEYIADTLKVKSFRIESEEFGVIPMTDRIFPERTNNLIYIGTAGGNTKPSSGYTFQFIQKHTEKLLSALLQNGAPFISKPVMDKRFHLYDSTLLNILSHHKMEGTEVFTKLFRNNNITDVLQFLDNETTLLQEMRLVTVLPRKLFVRAALQQLL